MQNNNVDLVEALHEAKLELHEMKLKIESVGRLYDIVYGNGSPDSLVIQISRFKDRLESQSASFKEQLAALEKRLATLETDNVGNRTHRWSLGNTAIAAVGGVLTAVVGGVFLLIKELFFKGSK